MKTSFNRIVIPTIVEVGKNVLDNIGNNINKNHFTNVVIFWGEGIKDLLGEKVINSLASYKINILEQYEYSDISINGIVTHAFSIPAKTDVVIGIGGGKVLDVTKYICFLNTLPFISVPTSTSNDGFSSSGCSLIINGKRTSVTAQMPFGIIVDIDVIKNAPPKFIFSGIGDLMSKITALYDWRFEENHSKGTVDDFAAMIARKAVYSFLNLEFKNLKEDVFLEELVDSLIMNGISMEIAGNSAPASGSEHLISHALDKIVEVPQLHGIQVGVATYLMSLVQNNQSDVIANFFEKVGFFNYVSGLGMVEAELLKAIDLAPSIKPHRYTYIHAEEMREKAKKFIREDRFLKEILKK